MYDWIVSHKISLGIWLKYGVDFLNRHAQSVFDLISTVLGAMVQGLTDGLLAVPALALIGIFAAGAYLLHRSVGLALFIVASLLLVVNLGYWEATMETLSLVIWSTATCVLIGVPVGILAAHRPMFYAAIRPFLDLMQTIPTFVYLIPTLVLFGLGTVPGIISTVIFALPAPIRLTQLGIASVPRACGRRLWPTGRRAGRCSSRSSCRARCRPSWPASPSASC